MDEETRNALTAALIEGLNAGFQFNPMSNVKVQFNPEQKAMIAGRLMPVIAKFLEHPQVTKEQQP